MPPIPVTETDGAQTPDGPGSGFDHVSRPPTDPVGHSHWIDELLRWREDARAAIPQLDLYERDDLAWARSAYVCGVVMLWDETFYDAGRNEFIVEEFLDRAEGEFGGYDALVLWHAYPRIGFDERNQFDFYRELPGGLSGLRDVVDRLHRRGVRALLDYNPWDTGTRRESRTDEAILAELVAAVDADGIFLDTMAQGPATLRRELDAARCGVVLQSEHLVPLERIGDHQMSWVQWPPSLAENQVLRNKWFEPRQMQHLVRRWHRSHADEIHTAWLNGTGLVVWDNVFGSVYPWEAQDKGRLAATRNAQRFFGEFFTDGEWTPFVPTGRPQVAASQWSWAGSHLWTVANRGTTVVDGSLLCHGLDQSSWRFYVVDAGIRELPTAGPAIEGTLAAGDVAAVLAVGQDTAPWVLEAIRQASAAGRLARPAPPRTTEAGAAAVVPRTVVPPRRDPDTARVPVAGIRRSFETRFLLRECGSLDPAPLADAEYPDLTGDIVHRIELELAPYAIDLRPVTNGEFLAFVEAGFMPAHGERFLHHLERAAADPDDPVTYVSPEDAQAYAVWSGARLPTPYEWQHALEGDAAAYGRRRVWEWTGSITSDGRNRFVVLKGGSEPRPATSEWYAESGPLTPDRAAKFLLFHPGLDRCSTIGFRCAVDISPRARGGPPPDSGPVPHGPRM